MDIILNYEEAAKLLGVPVGTVYAWVSQKKIPHLRLGPRLVRFRKTEVEKWLLLHHVTAMNPT